MRILIIKLSSLGDVIHCLPSLDALKRGFPGSKIDWLVENQHAEILEGHPDIDHLIVLRRKSWMKQPWQIREVSSQMKEFIKDLRSQDYDMVIDFQGLFRSGFLAWLSKGKRKIGFDKVREMAGLFYNEKAPLSTLDQHAVTRYLEILRYLGIDTGQTRFLIHIDERDYKRAGEILKEEGIDVDGDRRVVFVNPNARWQSKQWQWENFRELVKELVLLGYETVLTGGQQDAQMISTVFKGLGNRVHNIAGHTTLKCLAAMFKMGGCLVTNDSGPMHLAVASGLPVVALFGPSNPVRTGPFGWQDKNNRRKVLFTGEACSPCYKRFCRHKSCLAGISVSNVLNAVQGILDMSRKNVGR
ncbi:glycosyltransferase family 9 protein [bacterium]|nr:glycosyltransferase family 9 protein [bacterium]